MQASYFVYKQALLAEAERLVQANVLPAKEDIFYLTFQELPDVVRSNRVDDQLIQQRWSPRFVGIAGLVTEVRRPDDPWRSYRQGVRPAGRRRRGVGHPADPGRAADPRAREPTDYVEILP